VTPRHRDHPGQLDGHDRHRIARSVAGILLTGGASRRMGFDKASLVIEGRPAAVRIAGVLSSVTAPVVEVGPGYSGLEAVLEDPRGAGPLVALGTGAAALRQRGHVGAAIVLACDLPLADEALVRLLANWPGDASVVPVVDGYPQPLCARWSRGDLGAIAGLVGSGARSMRALLSRPDVALVDEAGWSGAVDARAFADVDTQSDIEHLGLRWHPGSPEADEAALR
jgi:molybdenum cofactor guanylyltransferase